MQYCRGESGESCWIGSLIQFSFHYRALDARLELSVELSQAFPQDSAHVRITDGFCCCGTDEKAAARRAFGWIVKSE